MSSRFPALPADYFPDILTISSMPPQADLYYDLKSPIELDLNFSKPFEGKPRINLRKTHRSEKHIIRETLEQGA
jgi:hypothetical protein